MQSHGDHEFYPAAGRRLGRYELVLRLARGGMAEVWLARQRGELGFTRVVALKVIRPELAERASFRAMFLDEARIAARLHHANVVEVVDLGEHDRVLYLAMAYIEGDSLVGLRDRLRERDGVAPALDPAIAARIMGDVCAGLHAAHELTGEDGSPLDLVHRDVSPHNILVGIDGIARLSDFGIAKVLGRLSEKTETGQVKGKLSYLSPEQTKRLPVDRRSDLFSTGIVLWEMLTGERLFRADDEATTLLNVGSKEVPDPRALADVPAAIADVALRALQRDPTARFQTGDEMRRALERAARDSRAIATANEVADLVSDLVLGEVEQRRIALRSAERVSLPAPSVPPPSSSHDRTVRPGRDAVRASARASDVSTSTVDVARISASTPAVSTSLPKARRGWLWVALLALPLTALAWFVSRPSPEPASESDVDATRFQASSASPSPVVVAPVAVATASATTTEARPELAKSVAVGARPVRSEGQAAALSVVPSVGSAKPKYRNPY